MVAEKAIEMFVGGLLVDPNTQSPVVILKDETGATGLPIWIGPAEATSIASALKGIPLSRPLTHDLMYTAIQEVGAKIQRIMITALKDSTYFAEIVISVGDKAIILDSRPSDAIAMAVRASAPIYVSEKVLEQAKVALPPDEDIQGEVDVPVDDSASEEGGSREREDLQSIDKDKWKDILEELDPKDFKYKV
jgi:bifunctional DNase/RNase